MYGASGPHTRPKDSNVRFVPAIFLWEPFFPDENSKLHSYKKLTNVALQTLLNELSTLDIKLKERAIN